MRYGLIGAVTNKYTLGANYAYMLFQEQLAQVSLNVNSKWAFGLYDYTFTIHSNR